MRALFSAQVARELYTLLSVFFAVPVGLTRGLAAMSMALTAEDEEEEELQQGDEGEQELGGKGQDDAQGDGGGGALDAGGEVLGVGKRAFNREDSRQHGRITLDGKVCCGARRGFSGVRAGPRTGWVGACSAAGTSRPTSRAR